MVAQEAQNTGEKSPDFYLRDHLQVLAAWVGLTEEKRTARAQKKIMAIKTDSTPVESPKNPETCNVFALLSLFCDEQEKKSWEERYRAGNLSYADIKRSLAEKYEACVGPLRARREELAKDRRNVWKILAEGSARAEAISKKYLEQMRSAVGLKYGR